MLAAGKALKSVLRRKSHVSAVIPKSQSGKRWCTELGLRNTIPRLIIADQPGFAADIARMLRLKNVGENLDQGYFGDTAANRDVVSWCFPNTFSIVDPVVEPKHWRLNQLPYFPTLDDVPPVSVAVNEHLQVLAELMAMADEIVCVMEPTLNGQLLFQDIVNHVRNKLNVNVPESKLFRVWLHDRTRESVRLGLKEPFPNDIFKNLAKSAHLRRFVDWSAQYNYSKLYTLLYSRHSAQVFQLNRIQLLLLKKVTERYLERLEFKPKPFYEIHLDCLVQSLAVIFKWTKDTSNLVPYAISENDELPAHPEAEETTIEKARKPFKKSTRHHATESKEEAHAIASSLEPTSIIVGNKTENVHYPPPLLYNLTSLQREAYERYSISASTTHTSLLALYEKHHLITNPNTASHQLPASRKAEIEETWKLFGSLRKYSQATKGADTHRIDSLDPRVFDPNLQPQENHAIIPIILNLSNAKKREAGMTTAMIILYDMIIRRFLAAMMTDMVHSVITVTLENADKHYFEAKAAVLKTEGWKVVGTLPKAKVPFNPGPSNFPTGFIRSSIHEEEAEAQEELTEQKQLYKTLSTLRLGDELKGFIPAAIITKEPSPPPLYTHSRVLAIMEDKSTLVNDDGSAATSSINSNDEMNTASQGHMMKKEQGARKSERKSLRQEGGLGTPEERADAITKLFSARWFRTRQDRYLEPTRKGILLTKLIQEDAITDISQSKSWDNTLSLIAKGKGSSSSAFLSRVKSVIQPDVSKHIPSTPLPSSSIVPASLSTKSVVLDATGIPEINENSNIVPSTPSSSDFAVAYDLIYYHTNSVAAKTLNEAPALSNTKCPKCGAKGHLKQGPSAYFCSAPKCNFTMPQIIGGKLLTMEEAKQLLQKKPTLRCSDLVDPQGNTFEASLILRAPAYKPAYVDPVVTKLAEPKQSSQPKTLPIQRLPDEELGNSRIVSVLSGPGRPTKGTELKKKETPPAKRGRPSLPEEVVAERLRLKVDEEMTKSMAKLAKKEKAKKLRETSIPAPATRVNAEGQIVKRLGRPRIGEYVAKKEKRGAPGRPRLSAAELKRRKALKRRVGRPTLAELISRKTISEQEEDSIDVRGKISKAAQKLKKKVAESKTQL